MVKSCVVATCKNTLGVAGISFHKIGKRRYANRLKAIGRSVDENLSHQNVICSKHFAEDDFIHFNGKKYLRLEALPRLFLPRRPSIEMKIDIKNNIPDSPVETKIDTKSEIPDRKAISPTVNSLDIDKDSWLRYQDMELLMLDPTSQDTLDGVLNQANLSKYPTNEFLASLISNSCDMDTLGLFEDESSRNLLEI